MAVREWDLVPERPAQERPALRLVPAPRRVPAPPRRGRPVAAILFVVLLAGAVGAPAIRSALETPPPPALWSHRPLPLAQVSAIDPAPGLGKGRPVSSEPRGGIVFVRCTRLWAALPDGSQPRKILEMPGSSSPIFSPDARTIAFFAPDGDADAIWMVGADGSRPTKVATLTSDGIPMDAEPAGLAWSATGKHLAFALVDPRFDEWSGGSSIWAFDLASGEFKHVADGWPAPFWLDRNGIGLARWFDDGIRTAQEAGPAFFSVGAKGGKGREKGLDATEADLTAAVAGRFSDAWAYRRGVAALGLLDGKAVVAVKRDQWSRADKNKRFFEAPSPYRIVARSRIALAQDTSRAIVTLIDRHGGSGLGILDLRTGEWTVLDYAWDGASSPAPTFSGPFGARRAARLTSDLFNNWNRRGGKRALLLGFVDRDDLFPFRVRGHVTGQPVEHDGDWQVPALVYGDGGGHAPPFPNGKVRGSGFAYRSVLVDVADTDDGRVVADPSPTSAVEPIRTVEDARAMLEQILGPDFKWPTFLPEGAELNPEWPIYAYSYGDYEQASVNFVIPDPDGKGTKSFSLSYGDVDFSLGCGGENDPEEGEVGEEPALFDHISYKDGRGGRVRTDQLLWPATFADRSKAFYSVYGDLGRATITRIAASMI